MKKHPVMFFAVILIAVTLCSLMFGRYPVTFHDIGAIIYAKFTGAELTYKEDEILFLLTEVRIPRILAAILVGAALSASGGVYQSMFLNPLVSPDILGVLAGASFGAALGIVIIESWVATQLLAFLFAIVAVIIAVALSRLFPRGGLLVLLLGGMISSAFFMSLSSLLKYMADPTRQLAELIYWLMGTFARSDMSMLLHVGPIIIIGVIIICLSGKTMNAISMGDDEALSLGVNVKKTRFMLIAVATLISASAVVIAGIVGWVGLVIPHMMRFFVGPDNKVLLPVSALGGGAFMLATDCVVRSVFTAELPIGIVTALIGLPLFVFSLYQNRGVWK